MNLETKYVTQNECYGTNRVIVPEGIMVHSTATPGVMADSWYTRWNKAGVEVCVHAFVDNTKVLQILPWNHRAWHCGVGSSGKSANSTHIAFEICEPAGFSYAGGSTMSGYDAEKQQPYFDVVWANAVELCVYLCKKYGLDETKVICHSEGAKLGIASNHADVMHWFPKHGQSMDTFRAAVKAALKGYAPTSLLLAALDKLAKLGVLSSPDYWKAHAGDLPYLEDLIVKAAGKATGAAAIGGISSVPAALAALVSANVIVSPDYWAKNYGKIPYLDQLLIKLAGAV